MLDGVQKFASVRCGRALRKSDHRLSVTATTACTLAFKHCARRHGLRLGTAASTHLVGVTDPPPVLTPFRHTPLAERGEVGGRAPRLYETRMTNRRQKADRTGVVRHLCSDGATRMRRIRPLSNPSIHRRLLADRNTPWSLTTSGPAALADSADVVDHLLAKGHARTSGASRIAGYIGHSDKWIAPWPDPRRLTPIRLKPTTLNWSEQSGVGPSR
jgi:hypothetical protein